MDRETFERIKEKAIEEVLQKNFKGSLKSQEKVAMHRLLEELLEGIMKGEREVFLENSTSNKGNGYYPRSLAAGSFKLHLNVPRDRNGNFRPAILPEPYRRVDESYVDLLMSLVINGYSESQLVMSLKELGLPYSEEELNKIKGQLLERLNDLKQKELPENAFAVFIDGYHTEIKDNHKVRKACVYTVLGIDLEGRKEVYGYYTFFGNENRADWLKVLNDLIERGLKRIMVIISDDFPGLMEAVKALYPLTEHQLCYVHLQRNVRRNMGKEDASSFNKELENIKSARDEQEGKERFERLCYQYKPKYPTFIKSIIPKIDNYLCFLKYPEEIRRYVYTTNSVESLHSRIEQIRLRLGGYFQSVNILEINLMLQIDRLKQRKWRQPIPILKAKAYELLQIFNTKFYPETQYS
jgi:putative transposase